MRISDILNIMEPFSILWIEDEEGDCVFENESRFVKEALLKSKIEDYEVKKIYPYFWKLIGRSIIVAVIKKGDN